ncbi:unnamed protein product, partial [Cladocopium goreaui]
RWYLHKHKKVVLTKVQLQAIYNRLAKHHSRDSTFLRAIAVDMELQPWKCQCGRLNKKVARTCASCHWGYAPTPQDWQWNPQSWPQWDQRQQVRQPRANSTRSTNSNRTDRSSRSYRTDRGDQDGAQPPDSPRPRGDRQKRSNRRPRRHHKGSSEAKEDADGAKRSQEPVWSSNLPRLQAVPTSTPTAPTSSSAEDQLRTLTGLLRKSPDQLTPETQAYLTSLTVKATHSTAKSLHSSVTKLEKAQNALTEAQGARLQLHSKWRNFVTEAVDRWTQSTEEFKKDDQILEAQIQAAKDALVAIKEQYAQTQTQLGIAGSSSIEISDEEENKMDAASAKISDGLVQMMGSLTNLKQTADQMVEEQQKAAKRPRLGETATEDSPFVEPDKMAAFDLGLPTTASFTPSPQRCGKRSGPKKVSFSTTIRLQFCAAESLLSASMDLSEEAFNHWPAKPWSLRQRSISTSMQPHPHDALSVEMKGNAFFHDSDEGSFVQTPPIKRLRNEHQVPDWQAFGRQGDHSDDDTDDGSSEHSTPSEADHSSQRSTSYEPQEDATSYNDGVVRTVLLYWRENPAIHAQISSIHAEGQLAEIAERIGIPRH